MHNSLNIHKKIKGINYIALREAGYPIFITGLCHYKRNFNRFYSFFYKKKEESKTQTIEKKDEKIRGETRHYSPANKEWSNSIYAFNKNSIKTLPIKDKLASNLIKSYFNFVPKSKSKARSRRMSNLIRRNSTKKIFVSKAEVKQTNDKVVITVYTFDREKESFIRKTYFFNESYKTEKKYLALEKIFLDTLAGSKRIINKSDTISAKKNITNLYGVLPKISRKKSKFLKKKALKPFKNSSSLSSFQAGKTYRKRPIKRLAKRELRRLKKRYIINKNLFKDRLVISVLKKKFFFKNIFFYCFIKWTLSIFKIKLEIFKFKKKNYLLIKKGKSFKVFNIKNGIFYFKNIKKINIILLQFLLITIKKALKSASVPFRLENKLYFLFKYFKFIYYKSFMQKYLKKEILALDYLYMLSLNKFKFEKYLPGLKVLIGKIYNKTVELNIVNLKYLHLNSDIFSESIAIKLRRKTNAFNVIKRSLKLAKIPSKFTLKSDKTFLNKYKALNVSDLFSGYAQETTQKVFTTAQEKKINKVLKFKDALDILLRKMFTFSEKTKTSAFAGSKAKKLSVLASVKYKWVTGVRVEAKGRLTRRFTAERSVFKFTYKGNLKNIDCSKNNLSTVMLRGDVKPNIQYSFANSRRRIGAFGVKGWISSN